MATNPLSSVPSIVVAQPLTYISTCHPTDYGLLASIIAVFRPNTTDRSTKWRFTLSIVALGLFILFWVMLQAATMDAMLNQLLSKAWIAFIAWDILCLVLLFFFFFRHRRDYVTRSVDWMRYIWVCIMANQATKMCLLYGPVVADFNVNGLNRFDSTSSLCFSSYLSVIIHAGLLYWCSGSSNRYEQVQALGMTSYLLSLFDLMDGIDLYVYHRSSGFFLGSSLNNAILAFVVISVIVSPFFAYVVVAEANASHSPQCQLSQIMELHLFVSAWLINVPMLIIRLYVYFEYVQVLISVFVAKNLIVWILHIFQPIVAFGREVRY